MTWSQSAFRKISLESRTTPVNVGPGSYNTSTNFSKIRTVRKISQPQSRDFYNRPDLVTPGPGAYNIEPTTTQSRPVSSFFKSRVRRDVYSVDSTNPSPAEYSRQQEWGKKQTIYSQVHHPRQRKYQPHIPDNANYLDEQGRLVRRNAPKRTEADIGPGTYETATQSQIRPSTINASKRNHNIFMTKRANTPAPAQYSPADVNYKIPIKIKGENKSNSKTPEINQSIGLYFTTKIPRSQSPIFRTKVARDSYTSLSDTPGPGAYTINQEPQHTLQKTDLGEREVVFGSTSVRFDNPSTDVPGPGAYTPQNIKPKSRGPASVLQNRAPNKELFPGQEGPSPGDYNIPDPNKQKPQKSPAFQSKEIRMGSDSNDVPGPGEYDLDFPVEERETRIFATRYDNTGDWIKTTMTDAPSPEGYTINRDMKGPRYSISRSDRFRKNSKKTGLGPGQYNLDTPFLKQSFNSAVPKLY
ncbi:hypothetical protein TVAG_168970 [Trichomonas vaginalis G3]|uniref:Uncharacterized protein n=1 Tax=Trichomonas vaginalis (strain ATCC PRA-98 / G3) TaxID=412133 RepID=A2EWR5_TRIV3|nr:spectrin binding [Trichomonas vaginalis G3]EAY02895.1 hypothetical protein TVAG_168970 [Trichomonas vaginalis G3]KAI5551260.1 spectrin binding [Trichomonas vaginalis G3]|eukprot:XP_001315118.1 hypothetical protein [Trichomonas vaginalis G3]